MTDRDQADRSRVNEQLTAVLRSLSENERRLLTKVVRIESENISMERPRIKEDLMKAVKEVVQ